MLEDTGAPSHPWHQCCDYESCSARTGALMVIVLEEEQVALVESSGRKAFI